MGAGWAAQIASAFELESPEEETIEPIERKRKE
jgi:hypothetical protein